MKDGDYFGALIFAAGNIILMNFRALRMFSLISSQDKPAEFLFAIIALSLSPRFLK
jgi:hypothetical protein